MVSVSDIARDWGVSRPYASRCTNHLGCPRTSLQAAREWREYCASKRLSTNPKQIARLLGDEDSEASVRSEGPFKHRTDNLPPPSIDSLHDALEAAIAAQEQAYCLLEGAIGETKESKMGMLLAVHNKALELRLKAEAQYRDALEQHRSG